VGREDWTWTMENLSKNGKDGRTTDAELKEW
jgi:hypothetical protein